MPKLPHLDQIEKTFHEGQRLLSLGGLHGSSRAFYFLEIQKRLGVPVCVITPHTDVAETMERDLQFFVQWQREKKTALSFPNWEILPYEPLSPFHEIVGERLGALDALSSSGVDFLITTAAAVLQKVVHKNIIKEFSFELGVGESMEMELLLDCLVDSGYEQADLVDTRGGFSLRGNILDIFPSNSALPVRLEFFGDELESIRRFDPDSQRSVGKLEKVRLLPTKELVLNKSLLEKGCSEIARADSSLGSGRQISEVIEKFRNVFPFPSAEMYSPYFYPFMQTIFDYLDAKTLVILEEPEQLKAKWRELEKDIQSGYLQAEIRGDIPPSITSRYISMQETQSLIDKFPSIENRLLSTGSDKGERSFQIQVKSVPSFQNHFHGFVGQVNSWRAQGFEHTVVAPTGGQIRRIRELLVENETDCDGVVGNVSTGFILPDSKIAIVAEHEIFGATHLHRATTGEVRGKRVFKGFQDLKPGDLVVHLDYGLGEFIGVKTLDGLDASPEFMEILYAEDEKLYLAMDRLDLVQKYFGGDRDNLQLDKLGGVSWKKTKEKARKSVLEMAQDLLKLYAERKVVEGHPYSPDTFMHKEFDDSFFYTETPDQQKAIEEVKKDLESPKPMDRLICGDVGYGKTEVAMRAAFKVVTDGKQVALLAPTTILTHQHLQTFQERMRAYPVKLGLLNRFKTPKEQRETIKKLETGEVDILIGTHRILQKDIRFKALGLVIIDEEQRFGVKHKEKLKELRKQVDVLTLTATPIPRTLHFSMMGLRELSIIETPPRDRLAIKTYTRKFAPVTIKEAIARELGRNGQVFFVHNRVESIHNMADYIQRLVPNAKIDVAHGQMKEHGLEKVMMRFLNQEINVLVCTTIIESGLDIPTANTIIINRADKFGLAQLYQLRGRVGRYKHQAYAYLLIPGELVLENDARKRLRAIEEMSELGSGFHLAARDLEIRGTGNLLGHKQSGHIVAIGFELYSRLMEDTVKELKGEKVEETIEPDITLDYKGAIPRSYIPVLNQRLEIYRRLYMAREIAQLSGLKEEIKDRFGKLPLPLEKLLALLELKLMAKNVWISEMKQISEKVFIRFHEKASFNSEKLVGLANKAEGMVKILPNNRLSFFTGDAGWLNHFLELQSLLRALKKIMELPESPKQEVL